MLKLDISDGFYRIDIALDDIPHLGVVFPVKPGAEPLVAFPLVLHMGWKNSPPIFSSATETAANIANCDIQSPAPVPNHPLGTLASTMDDPMVPPPRPCPMTMPLQPLPSPTATRSPNLPEARSLASVHLDPFSQSTSSYAARSLTPFHQRVTCLY